MPRFSVIIACYNAEHTLAETLASLRNQNETEWEAICVDDGSSDATRELLNTAAQSDPRIRVVSQQNAGPSRARNAGAALAQSDWLAFLDADDIWLPQKLSATAQAAAGNPDVSALYSQVAFFDPGTGATTTTSSTREGITVLTRLLGENPVCTLSNLTVRRDAFFEVGQFREDMRYSEDLEFLIRLVAAGKTLCAIPACHVRYRASFDGLSANLLLMHDGWRQAVRSAGATVTPRQHARAEALHLRYLARRALRLNVRPMVAWALALNGVKLAPLTFLGDGYRGPATFVSCLFAPLLPAFLRRALFS